MGSVSTTSAGSSANAAMSVSAPAAVSSAGTSMQGLSMAFAGGGGLLVNSLV